MNIRQVEERDLKNIRFFVKNNPPLDFHTLYTYWVLYSQFRKLWYICEEDGDIVGFISGIKNLTEEPTAMIWQIGVAKIMRGKGVSRRLLDAFTNACNTLKIKQGCVTINPSNKASLNLFKSYFDANSNFKISGNLDLSDEFSLKAEYENIYTFSIN